MAKKGDVEVGPHKDGGWQVLVHGNQRASAVTDTKQEALVIARARATEDESELIIKNKDGKIAGKDSEGNDPKKSKG